MMETLSKGHFSLKRTIFWSQILYIFRFHCVAINCLLGRLVSSYYCRFWRTACGLLCRQETSAQVHAGEDSWSDLVRLKFWGE